MSVWDMACEAFDTATGPLSCIAKNVFMDEVYPVVGSVVRTDLALGLASHTGIFVGDDRIVEITEVNDMARVQVVTPKQFVNGGITRTGVYIYTAAAKNVSGNLYALGNHGIAERALKSVGSRGKYFTMCNNCHQFTRYCITGIDDEFSTPWTVDDVVEALKEKFGVDNVCWRSTGSAFSGYKS